MARVTVEDCLLHVKNRFELVLIAAKRARQLARGTFEPMVDWDNDKPTVVALREIAEGYTDFDKVITEEVTANAVIDEMGNSNHQASEISFMSPPRDQE